jgi:outer membrane protein assembly factor BamE (lipoprotein component of BamABCDE complex)
MRMRRTSFIASALVISFALSGCGAGLNAATRNINRVTDGNEITIDKNGSEIRVVNLTLVDTEDGAAVVVATIINQGLAPDELLGFSVQGVQATLTGETALLTNKPLYFEGEQANAKAVFAGANPKAGTNVTVSIGFAKAGFVTAEVIIRDKRGDFASVISGAKLLTSESATATNK